MNTNRSRFTWSRFTAFVVCMAVALSGHPVLSEEYEWVGNYIDQAGLIPNTNYWSIYEGAYWLGLKVPGLEYSHGPDDNADDDALLGTGYDPGPPYVKSPPWHLQRGGTLYFGDFTHPLNSSISPNAYYEAHNLVNRRLDVQSGNWTFDFGPVNRATGILDSGKKYDQQGSYRLTEAMIVGNRIKHTGTAGNASLTIQNGTLTTPFAALANVLGSQGHMTVSGKGAEWIIKNEAGFGDLHVGETGQERLIVEQGGLVDVLGETVLGWKRGSRGSMSIRSSGQFVSGGITIGGLARGTLHVSSGGKVQANNKNVYLGTGNDAFGEVTVNGPNSSMTDIFRLTVGGVYHTDTTGRGKLAISNGGLVTSRLVSIGNRSHSRGEVTVSGAGSEWQANVMMLGDDGLGTVTVQDGGRMTSRNAVIGNTENGVGNVTVRGGSLGSGKWDVSRNLTVGGEGRGSLAVGFGGLVTVGEILRVGEDGSLKIAPRGRVNVGAGDLSDLGVLRVGSGGTLAGKGIVYADLLIDGGTVAPGASPGSLYIDGNVHQLPGSLLSMEIGGTTPGIEYDQIIASGTMQLEGDMELKFLDGFVPRYGDRFELLSGATTNFSGTLRLLNAPTNFGFAASLSNGVVSLIAVPEPTTAAYALCGLVVTLLGRFRRVSISR